MLLREECYLKVYPVGLPKVVENKTMIGLRTLWHYIMFKKYQWKSVIASVIHDLMKQKIKKKIERYDRTSRKHQSMKSLMKRCRHSAYIKR